ncbi:gliding motility-associated C-terminal domain-containing protein [Prevotellamassilia timonensis]|uniref:gliding motility-associated C-terminal domain-containing protein n=1 Tax=Prevotellamassilia timonensis TaxID=1852370 RepID=UPI003FED60DC
MQRFISFLLTLVCGIITIAAQSDDLPTANPVMTYTDDDGQEVSETQYDGSAPFKATFKACPEHTGNYTPLYEWRFTRSGETTPFLVRYDQDTEYEFLQSGTFSVELRVSFVQGTDTIAYEMDEPFSIAISESKLEVPNAFTPNGDGVNDVFRVKEGYKSIVSFKAMVFDRWGKKLYEWTDPAGGWDGRSAGHAVPDGGYYLNIQARGADGKHYNIKKVINVLRGYTESGTTTD